MPRISNIEMVSLPERHFVRYTQTVEVAERSLATGRAYGRLSTYLQDVGCIPSDLPFIGFRETTENMLYLEAYFPVPAPLPGNDSIESVVLPPRKMIFCFHLGPYNLMDSVYDEMYAWLVERKYLIPSMRFEAYCNGQEYPITQWLTRISMPLER